MFKETQITNNPTQNIMTGFYQFSLITELWITAFAAMTDCWEFA